MKRLFSPQRCETRIVQREWKRHPAGPGGGGEIHRAGQVEHVDCPQPLRPTKATSSPVSTRRENQGEQNGLASVK